MEVKAGYKQTEVGIIPQDWNATPLPDVIWFQEGPGLRKWQFRSSGLKVINVTNLQENGYLDTSNTERYISWDEFERMYKHFLVDESDVVVASSGNSYCKTAIVRERDLPLVMNTSVIRFKPKEGITRAFMLIYLKSKYFKDQIDLMITGGAQPNFGPFHLRKVLIPLPPAKAEQKAIAEALSDADALIEALDRLIAKKRQVKQGAMSELLSGKRRLSGFSDEWKIVLFESLCRTFTKQTGFDYSASIKPSLIMEHRDGFLPFIQNKDFEGKNINYQTDYFVPEKIAVKFPRILLDEKCLLISISGSIGNVAIFSNLQTAFVGGAIAVGKFFNHKHLDWVMYYLHSNEGQNKFFGNVKAGSHHNLTLEDIRKVEIPMPSEEEQTAIVEILSDMDAEIAALEGKLAKARQVKQGMIQELLTGRIRLV